MFRRVVGVEPVIRWEMRPDPERPGKMKLTKTDEQKLDDGPFGTGYPVWELGVAVKIEGSRKADTITVQVPHPVEPDMDDERVVFGGLEVAMAAYANERGDNVTVDSNWKFTARTVALAAAPSQRPPLPAKAPAPPPPAADREPAAAANGKGG